MKLKIIKLKTDKKKSSKERLKYWVQRTKAHRPGLCKEWSCKELATEGALVRISNSDDESHYIIPLCREHALMLGEEINAFTKLPLVSDCFERQTI